MPENTRSDREFLSVREVASTLGMSGKTVRRRITDGTIPAVWIGGSLRVRRRDLEHVGSPVVGGSA